MSAFDLIPVDGTRGYTRRHAIKVFAACAGGVMLGGPLRRTLADLPWGEKPPADLLNDTGEPLRLGAERPYEPASRHACPTLSFVPREACLWTSWTQLHDGREALFARRLPVDSGQWGPPVLVSEPGVPDSCGVYDSDLAFVAGRMVAVWSQHNGDGWTLHARSLDPATGQLGPCRTLAGTPGTREIHWHPVIAPIWNRALVVWQAQRPGEQTSAILARLIIPDAKPTSDVFTVASDAHHDYCHPAIAAFPDDRHFAVAFERHERCGTQNIHLVTIDRAAREVSKLQPVTTHPASDVAPALAFSPDGGWLWAAWHSNRREEAGWDVTPWYRIAALRLCDNTWHMPVGADERPPSNERGTVQGFELVRLAVSPGGVVCVLGRASHNFYLQYYSKEGKSPLYRLPKDGWGGRGRLLGGVFDSGASLWVTRRDLDANVLGHIDGFVGLSGPPPMIAYAEPTRVEARPLAGTTPRYEWPEPTGKRDELRLYFGDIHGHSWQSDGMGDPEASFLRARDVFRDDFHALTDHDNFVGKRLSDAQWQAQKDLAEHYHAPGSFVTLFGQEWTTPRTNRPHGWGHLNVYSADPTIPLFDHTDPRYRDLPDLYAALRRHGALAIPHHIGWTGVRWDALDRELTPVVEICSVHGAFEYEGNEPIRHRGGMPGCFYRDGLAAGLWIGVVGGSDQHGLTWHHGVCWKRNPFRAGLTGVWAPELTRDAILEAIRARRTFATTGVKLQLYFAVNDEPMGATIETEGPPTIRADVAVPPEEGQLAWLQIIRDGSVVHRYGGEGQRSRCTFVDERCPKASTCCYYLRVTLADNNMAWSSPVWVTRA